MFNLDQLQVENYVKREPKYLFKVNETRCFTSGKSTKNSGGHSFKNSSKHRSFIFNRRLQYQVSKQFTQEQLSKQYT